MSSILKKHNFIFVVLLGFSLFERLYNKTSISGQYSIYIVKENINLIRGYYWQYLWCYTFLAKNP